MKCKASVSGPGGFHTYPCSNLARYGDFCGIHCPEKRAERAAKRGPTQWEKDCAERDQRRRELDALKALLAEARTVVHRTGSRYLRMAVEKFDRVEAEGRAK